MQFHRQILPVRLTLSIALIAATACGGGDKASNQPAGETAAAAPAVAAAAPTGEEIFARCAVCHQATGLGVPGNFPPLAGSEVATGPAGIPIRILLHGLQGPLTVKGATYNGAMMPGGGVPMSDAEIANVLTYVRSSFGNTASAVTPAEVAAVRAETSARTTPWTAEELERVK